MFTHHPPSSRMSRSHVPCSPPEVQVADTRSSAPAISMVRASGAAKTAGLSVPGAGWRDDGNKETKYMMKRMKNLDLVSKTKLNMFRHICTVYIYIYVDIHEYES